MLRAATTCMLALALGGCPERGERTPGPGRERCTKFGATCELEPGKLGSCVVRDGCTQGDCLVCQSQH